MVPLQITTLAERVASIGQRFATKFGLLRERPRPERAESKTRVSAIFAGVLALGSSPSPHPEWLTSSSRHLRPPLGAMRDGAPGFLTSTSAG